MTAQKHTPGPWEVVNGTDVYLAGDTFARHFIADCDPDNAPLINDGDHPYTDATYEEAKANALLIAASPTMLEALYEAEEYFDNRADADHDETGFVPNEEMKLLTVVRAAIAKAEGQ